MGDTWTANSSPNEQSGRQAGSYALDDEDLIVVSNREPYQHRWDGDGIEVTRPNGGLTSALDGAMRTIDGTWIAWGDAEADAAVVDDDDRVAVPPDADADEQYDLERIWLTDEEVDNYYLGFSNQVLWPICHSALTEVHCASGYWDHYGEVNQRFADAVVDRIDDQGVVWLQDYHFGLAPRMIRSRVDDDVFVAHFWHIPWPGEDVFRACPHREELLRGLLGNDLLGFHVPRYCTNFLQCVDEMLPEATIDWDAGQVFHRDGETVVSAFPLGVDADRIQSAAGADGALDHWSAFAADHDIDDGVSVALGVDRLDYTKGIPQRLEALERLWESRPELRGELTYVQIGTKSRSEIPAYQEVQERVAEAVDRINERFGTDDWQPVVYTTERLPNEALYALYRRADVALVSPIRDGMNLVAQEYIAAQVDDDGVLVLSDQAGAHELFKESTLPVTPQDIDAFARTIHAALTMSADERHRRMRSLRRQVHSNDIGTWTDTILDAVNARRAEKDGDGGRARR